MKVKKLTLVELTGQRSNYFEEDLEPLIKLQRENTQPTSKRCDLH